MPEQVGSLRKHANSVVNVSLPSHIGARLRTTNKLWVGKDELEEWSATPEVMIRLLELAGTM